MIDTPQAAEGCGHPNQPAGEVLKPELKSCPFCGGKAFEKKSEYGSIMVGCTACGVGMAGNMHDHPGNYWNTRPLPQGERAVAWRSIDQTKITQDAAVAFNWSLAGYEVEPLFTRPSDTGWQPSEADVTAAAKHQAQTFLGARGLYSANLLMRDLYKIVRDRLEYMGENYDPDAVTQNVCVEVEKKMGVYPRLPAPPTQEDGR